MPYNKLQYLTCPTSPSYCGERWYNCMHIIVWASELPVPGHPNTNNFRQKRCESHTQFQVTVHLFGRVKGQEVVITGNTHGQEHTCAQLVLFILSTTQTQGMRSPIFSLVLPTLINKIKTIPYRHAQVNLVETALHRRPSSQMVLDCARLTTKLSLLSS